MSRRGRSGPAISLFAFQDIITSVTAIVIVVVLFLTLDLVQRKRRNAETSPGQIAVDLIARLAEIDSEFAALRRQAEETDSLVREVAAASPAEIRDEVARREGLIASLLETQKRLQRQRDELRQREKRVIAEQFDLEPAREQRKLLEKETADLQRVVKEVRQDDRPIYTLPRGFRKEGWLAVVESGRILVAPLGRAAKPIEFRAKGSPLFGTSAAEAFAEWIDAEGHASGYFLLLIRPGGSTAFDDVEKKLSSRSTSYGFDLVGTDSRILHPERGAAP